MPTLIPDPPIAATRKDLAAGACRLFETTFGVVPAWIAVAPGRVNLIGEHTDYNGGYVLPAAIDRSLAVAAGPRSDRILSVYSHDMRSLVQVPLDNLRPLTEDTWVNYAAGVAFFLIRAGVNPSGANLCILGDVPQGAGLSSSAALGIASARALLALFGGNITPIQMIKLAQQSENEFVGVRCGIMDQFVSLLGRANNAVFIDCDSLDSAYVPLPSHLRLLICDTGIRRELGQSEYNKRREECLEAVKQLSTRYPSIRSLRDVSLRQLEDARGLLDPLLRKRARHVITENERVLGSVRALKETSLGEFGKLMYQSHLSLKLDFEVSCPELDAVVDICAEAAGVYGARMTGAGFGGSAVCLVEEQAVEELKVHLEMEYPQRAGRPPSLHICRIEDGATVFPAQGQ